MSHKICRFFSNILLYLVRRPLSQAVNLICALSLLENLVITAEWVIHHDHDDNDDGVTVLPLTSPPLTGTLDITGMLDGLADTARWLLDLPNGVHFRKLVYKWSRGNEWANALVERCSETLEAVDIRSDWSCTSFYFLG